MSKIKNAKNKLKSRIAAIKKINDDPKGTVDNVYDTYLSDLPSTDALFGKKLDDYLERRKKKIDNKEDIFSQIMEIFDSFMGSNRPSPETIPEPPNRRPDPPKLFSRKRLQLHARNSAQITAENAKRIILDNVKKSFFASDGICGTEQTISVNSLTLKPQEFDFLNVFTVNPTSATGQIVYEPTNTSDGLKVNRELYESFSGTIFEMLDNNNSILFDMDWNTSNQEWTLSGLMGDGNYNVEEFFNDYYSSIELPDIEHIIKTSMLMTIQSNESNPLFDKGMNNVNRLLTKLFAFCGSPTNNQDLVSQNAVDLLNENDQTLELFFDFDDVEGIDIDGEDARLRKVLRFTDCNNFEVPVNNTTIEDFIKLGYRKSENELIDSTFIRAATDASILSNSTIPIEQLNLSLLNTFILNIPKALVLSVLTPKIFLPVIIIYKIVKYGINEVVDVLVSIKNLSLLFFTIVEDLFWFFLREFWKLIKVDLLAFITRIVLKILKNKHKRYIVIITALISILTKILEEEINNCFDIFNVVLKSIDLALSAPAPFNIPGILLGFSDFLPGYSQDRALLNILERMENAGVTMGPLFGEDNLLPSIVKSIIDGNTEEIDTNSFVKVSNKQITIPTPLGPIIIPPGILNSSGKLI